MRKNKSYYIVDYTQRFYNMSGKYLSLWGLIKEFISFLRNPEALQIKITKPNNIIISQNQTWEYNETIKDYILETDLRMKNHHDLMEMDKFIY